MSLKQDVGRAVTLVRETLAGRRVEREVREKAREQALPTEHFEIALYFPDSNVNLYQLRQWYRPLEAIAATHPVVIICRMASAAHQVLAETSLPVAYTRTVGELESFVATHPLKLVLYVNQNAKNFQMMRYGRRWHVFINHGESDKMYMTTNQFKAYDFALIAGDAARARLGKALWGYNLDERTIEIGRPQVDFWSETAPFVADERPILLYAPTWEGDRPAAAYGSIGSHGEALVAAAMKQYRIVYRAHPRSGVLDRDYAAAHRRIVRMLETANLRGGGHVIDRSGELGWQLLVSDVAVLDVSAMIYDRLAAGRPLLVTRPRNPAAEIDAGGFLSEAAWLDAASGEAMLARVDEVRSDPAQLAELERWRRYYFGDGTPGSAQARFAGALDTLIERWQLTAQSHQG